MNRRIFLSSLTIGILTGKVYALPVKLKKYRAKIKTKNKSVIWTTVQARDEFAAKALIEKRYPGCTILLLQEV